MKPGFAYWLISGVLALAMLVSRLVTAPAQAQTQWYRHFQTSFNPATSILAIEVETPQPAELEYQLTYQHTVIGEPDPITEQVVGAQAVGVAPATIEIYLGTCSEYGCVPHNATEGALLFTGTVGQQPINDQWPVDFAPDQSWVSMILGRVFQDHNADGMLNGTDQALANWTVYLDDNFNQQLDSGEASTSSDLAGQYQFSEVALGVQHVCRVLPNDWTHTWPPSADQCYSLTSNENGEVFAGVDFGSRVVLPPSPAGPAVSSSTSPAQPPVCRAVASDKAPANLHIVSSDWQQVTIAWEPVSPATHYAVVVTRLSDGAQYGSPNVGNVTSYTIQGLTGGEQYRIEVLSINDCAPGPRASVLTGLVAGLPGIGQPSSAVSPKVLGAEQPAGFTIETELATLSAGVAGVTGSCSSFRWWWLTVVTAIVGLVMSRLLFGQSFFRKLVAAMSVFGSLVLLHRWQCQPWPWLIATGLVALILEVTMNMITITPPAGQHPARRPVSKAKPVAPPKPVAKTKVTKPKPSLSLLMRKPVAVKVKTEPTKVVPQVIKMPKIVTKVPAAPSLATTSMATRKRRRRRPVVRFFV